MSERELCTWEELRELPLRAIVAYALRCARRVQPLLQPRRWIETEEAEAVERALDRVEGFCRAEPILGVDFEAAHRAARAAASNAHLSGQYAAYFAAHAAAHALRAAINALTADAASEPDEDADDSGPAAVERSDPDVMLVGDGTDDALAAVLAARAVAAPTDDTPFEAVEVPRLAHLAANAAEEAAAAAGTEGDAFRPADDYPRLLELRLGSFPNLGTPIDPGERGPLGKLWQGKRPAWFQQQLTLW
jgi:hypothetical protein